MDTRKRMGFSTIPKNYKQLRNVKSGKDGLPKTITHQLIIQYQIVIPENTYMQVMLYRPSKLYFCIYTHICMQQQLIKDHKFEREKGRVYGRVWREKKERKMT